MTFGLLGLVRSVLAGHVARWERTVAWKRVQLYTSPCDERRGVHQRVNLYVGDADEDSPHDVHVSVELHVPSSRVGIGLNFNPHDEKPFHGSALAPPVGLYWAVESGGARDIAQSVVGRIPGDMGSKYSGREFRLAAHDGALWWSLGADDAGWPSRRPRWRYGSFRPLGFHCRHGEPLVIGERDVLVPLPERSYRARAVMTRAGWGWSRLPRRFDKVCYTVEITTYEGEQIPIPGKGENAWDCGDDAVFSHAGPSRSIEDAVGRLVASVLETRAKRGGASWTPERLGAA